jgi:cytochrome c biogenesis protein CcmG/thiol:disulfide interchange protein DsbE
MRWLLWLPLALFALIVAVVMSGLIHPASTDIRSQMVGKPLPEFTLPAGLPSHPPLAKADIKGGPRLINIFASWCLPCAVEAPQLMALKRAGVVIDGIAIRDRPEDLAAFLARYGDPYSRIGSDANSRVQLALGSSGVPESFVVDGQGVIRLQHIGDIREENVPTILAAIEAAK